MDYQLTQTGPEVQEILDKGAESYSKAEIDAQVDELQDGIDSSVKNKGSESNIVVGVGNSSNIGITSSSIGMETGNSAILIGNDITLDTSGAVKYNGSRVATATDLQGKQDVIRDLQTIRDGAAAGATAVQPAALAPIQSAIDTIEAVIPSTATANNKLTDKNYVDNSISTNTANFVGTFNSLAELQAVQNPTNNDYGFVIEQDAAGNEYYDRYKFNGSQWLFEYKVESTPFTAAQWAAIQSGITSALVTKLEALPTSQQLSTQLSGKQDTISDLSTIRSNAAAAAANTGDKAYNAADFSGLGRANLQKNIVEVSGTDKNVLTQAMVNTANTIYHIQYDYDLNGQTITLPANVTLQFEGGSLANGTIVGNHTMIDSVNVAFKKDLTIQGTWKNEVVYSRWFDFISSEDGVTDNSLQFKQLQAVINGTHGCRVEFTKGYYQTQIIGMEPEAYVEINGVTYPKWAMNTYQQDDRVVLHILEIPFVDINLNGSTIQGINITCPGWTMINFSGVENAYIHDGTLIGMAINNFSYPNYANYNWQTLQAPVNDYEFSSLLVVEGGFSTIYNMTTKYATGDGIMVGSGKWYYRVGDVRPSGVVETAELVTYQSSGYSVKNCEVCYCGRNGITMHSSESAILDNCHIHHIGSDAGNGEVGTDGIQGRNPRSGINVEFEDGLGLQPIVNWIGLYIHDCGLKSFGFAIPSQSIMKQFKATNCRFIGLGLPNNISSSGEKAFNNCYFEHIGKEGGLLGSATYNNCVIIVKALGLNVGANTFENCTITDEYEGNDTTTYFFAENIALRIFRNCTITIKHRYGYISNNTFYNCTLNFYYNSIAYAMGAEFYDCVFHNDPDDATNYSFQFRTGNNAGSTRGHIILERCVLEKARGYGTGVNDYFFSVDNYQVVIKDCQFTKSLSMYHGSPCGVISIQGSKFKTLYINGYQQTTTGVVPITINGCDIETITIWSSNALQIEIDNSIVGITTTQYVLKNVLFRKCIVSNNIARTTAAYKDVGVKGIDTIFDFAYTANTDNYNLENCYIKGVVTEANYTGTKNACSFETPLPTSGTTAQRPSASVTGVGFKYFDSDLDKPVYSDGTSWIDGTGAPASNSLKLLSISQNDYDNLGTYDSSTLYVITSS